MVGTGARARGRRALVLGVVLALGAAACGAGDSPGPADAADTDSEIEADAEAEAGEDVGDAASAEATPLAVEALTETFVDDSRPTDDPPGAREAATRTLETDIYVPEGEGPFPLIVHAHGFDGNPGKFTRLLTAWAEAGYVVAAPTFPLTNDLDDARSLFADFVNQPADVSFVVDELLALSAGDHAVLGGRVDEARIGVSGLSLGGATSYGAAFNSCCRDERVGAVIVMSGEPLDFVGGTYAFDDTPLLLSLSRDDPIVSYEGATTPFDEAAGPKVLLTLESDAHFEPYEDEASPHDDVVAEATTTFWDSHLRDDPAAADRLVATVEAHDLTELSTGGS